MGVRGEQGLREPMGLWKRRDHQGRSASGPAHGTDPHPDSIHRKYLHTPACARKSARLAIADRAPALQPCAPACCPECLCIPGRRCFVVCGCGCVFCLCVCGCVCVCVCARACVYSCVGVGGVGVVVGSVCFCICVFVSVWV